jgi:tetratricopeptide (TPR) repeat protein
MLRALALLTLLAAPLPVLAQGAAPIQLPSQTPGPTAPAPGAGPAPAATPSPAARAAEARRTELDRAFAALKDAPDAAGAALVEGRIRQLWAQAVTPSVALLLRRGVRNIEANQAEDALEDFDAAITLGPEVAEAWHLRAQAQARLGEATAAARDLQEALRLEPRNWGALLTLAGLQQQQGNEAGALRSLDAALAIHPKLPGGAERRRELRRKVEGDAT